MNKQIGKKTPLVANNHVPISTFDSLRIPERHRYFLQHPDSDCRVSLLKKAIIGHYSLIKNQDGTVTVSVRVKDKSQGSFIEKLKLPDDVSPHMLSLTDSTSRKENQVLLVFDAGEKTFALQPALLGASINNLLYVSIEPNKYFSVYLIDGKFITQTSGSSIQGILDTHYKPAFHEQALMK